jgi:hypothetical protein
MGQTRGVQVVNFVGQGSIEEGMLSVLAFKKSLFAGVLDGGEHEVFLQGTRLSQFMESVEQVAGAMGEADADAAGEPLVTVRAGDVPQAADTVRESVEVAAAVPARSHEPPTAEDAASRAVPADPWAALFEVGATLLQGLATARTTAAGTPSGAAPITIERDPVTGQASVRLPLPDSAVLQKLARAFEPWLR